MCSKYYYLSNLGISGRACPWKAPCFPAWLHPRYPLLRRYSLREKERLSSLVSPSIHLSVSTTVTLTGKAWPQIYSPPSSTRGFPGGWLSTKESACQCGRLGFYPRVRKIPQRRKRQPTPVCLPGKSHGQRNLPFRGSQKSWT